MPFSSTLVSTLGSIPFDTFICRELLNTYKLVSARSDPHFLDLSRSIRTYSPLKHSLLSLNLQPTWFLAFPCFKSLGMISFSLIIHAFHAFRPRFWDFLKILGFFKIVECLLKFWDGFLFKWYFNLMHCITQALLLYFHAFTCVLYMLKYLCAGRFGLGWAHDAFYFTCHMLMHFHAYVPYIQYISIYLNYLKLFWVFLSSPSLFSLC